MGQFDAHKKVALFFIAPQCLITLIFFLWPALEALKQSFFFKDAFGLQQTYAGLTNFTDLIKDPSFFKALMVTMLFALLITLITFSMGLILAYFVSRRGRSKVVYKSLLLWPYAIAPAAAGILWRFLCQPALGWFSQTLNTFHIDFNYLTHPKQALFVVILASVWQQLSYNFLFFLVAIQSIPKTLLDAAILDGASRWQQFWSIILPLISPTSFFLLITNLIYALFDTFGIIDVLTHGGPGSSTTTLMYKIYHDGFIGMDLGASAAESVLLMFLVILLTLIQFRYIEKRVHYS